MLTQLTEHNVSNEEDGKDHVVLCTSQVKIFAHTLPILISTRSPHIGKPAHLNLRVANIRSIHIREDFYGQSQVCW